MAAYEIFSVLCLVAAVFALPSQDVRSMQNNVQTENDLLESIHLDCLRQNSLSCVKYKLFNLVDKTLDYKDTVTVMDGVKIVKTKNSEQQGAPRAISGNETVESLILNRVQKYLESHTISVDLKGSDVSNTITSAARSFEGTLDYFTEEEEVVEEGRGKKKKKKKIAKILGPILAIAAIKAAILKKLAIAGIALIAGKALIIAKIALIIGVVSGLKGLLSKGLGGFFGGLGGGGGGQVVEVVAHPQHSSSHISSHEVVHGHGGGDYGSYGSSGHGGWGRSSDAQQLAYRAHIQDTTSSQ